VDQEMNVGDVGWKPDLVEKNSRYNGDIDGKHQAPGVSPGSQIPIHRRPGQAKREPGPITTGLRICKRWGRYVAQQRPPVVMGPCFRRDDDLNCKNYKINRLKSAFLAR